MASWSGLYNGVLGTSYALVVNTPATAAQIARLYKAPDQFVARRHAGSVVAATAIVSAAAAAVTSPRITHDSEPGVSVAGGGVRTVTSISRITLAATAGAAGEAKSIWLETTPTAGGTAEDRSGNGHSTFGPRLG